MTQVQTERSRATSGWVALVLVYVLWGSTYLAIRVGVRDLPPLLLAGIRYVIAGAVLYPIAVRTGGQRLRVGGRPGLKSWAGCAVIGLLLLFAGNGGLTVGEKSVASGFAAVLVATVPLWIILFSRILDGQRVSWATRAGLGIGLAGVAVLAGTGSASTHLTGVLIVLGGSAAWGFGTVIAHRLALPTCVLLAAALEMLTGGIILLLAAAVSGEFSAVQWSAVHASAWWALAWLIGPGSIVAFTAYGYALSHLPVSTVATYAYVNPVVAVLLGVAILGERLTALQALGSLLVIGAVALSVTRPRGRDGKHNDMSAEVTGVSTTSVQPDICNR